MFLKKNMTFLCGRAVFWHIVEEGNTTQIAPFNIVLPLGNVGLKRSLPDAFHSTIVLTSYFIAESPAAKNKFRQRGFPFAFLSLRTDQLLVSL